MGAAGLFGHSQPPRVYLIQGGVQITRSGPHMITAARFHLLGLVAGFLAWRAIHYHLEKYNLLYSDRGVVYGAGFTDIHAQLPVLTVMIIASAWWPPGW